jgi:hypothetical protein
VDQLEILVVSAEPAEAVVVRPDRLLVAMPLPAELRGDEQLIAGTGLSLGARPAPVSFSYIWAVSMKR